MASRSLTSGGPPHSSIRLPSFERLKSTNRQENTMQDRCFRGPVKPSSLHNYLVPVAFWRPQLRRLRHPLQDVFLRCVVKLFQHLDNMVIGGRGFCRSRCQSCFQPMRGGDGMRTPPTVWLRSHPPCPKTKTYIKTKWARAPLSPVGPYRYPKAAGVPPLERIPRMQLFHICGFSLQLVSVLSSKRSKIWPPPGFHTTAREPKRAHFRVQAFKNTNKIPRNDPKREKEE